MTTTTHTVGINLDARCNARCAHCCVSSSPQSELRLDDDHVDAILDDLLAQDDVTEISFTGGEPFLRRERLLELLTRVHRAGRRATCVTNGFWGVTPRAADAMLARLEEVGLRDLTLSWDEFHSPHVSAQRIRNVLDAARDRRVRVALNVCVSRTRTSDALLTSLGDSVHGIAVTKFPVVPAGEARSLPDDEFPRRPVGQGSLWCPGLQVIYHHDGFVYPCCSPPIFDTDMTLGGVEQGFREVVDKIERNALLGILQREGLRWFVDEIRAVDPTAAAATATEVVSACELCSLVLRDTAALEMIRPRITTYWEEKQRGSF